MGFLLKRFFGFFFKYWQLLQVLHFLDLGIESAFSPMLWCVIGFRKQLFHHCGINETDYEVFLHSIKQLVEG